ncbi:MAG: hypothetical protein AAB316_07850, partial [Bacteroidota bacterium]
QQGQQSRYFWRVHFKHFAAWFELGYAGWARILRIETPSQSLISLPILPYPNSKKPPWTI